MTFNVGDVMFYSHDFELGKLKHWVLTILATSRALVCLEQEMTSTVDATGEPA